MTDETDSSVDAQLRIFEATARSVGPDAAFRQFAQMLNEKAALRVLHAYEKKVGIITNLPGSPTLQEKRFDDWYSGPGEDDRFWPALKTHLLEKKKWPASTVDSLDRESTNVMKRLAPVYGPVDLKGLVVGYVQSGKTANYSALIAKAADVGYRLIIVLAGIHNSLRRQTQLRLQGELIYCNERIKPMWHTFTLPTEDFRARGTNTDAFLSNQNHQRILLVVKKNAHVLGRLIKWLGAAQERLLEECPALIIDDEADQASVNSGKAGALERTTINRLILKLKQTLPKSAYVGYTATPFANVLIDPSGKDLYPSDFIVALTKPPNYFGAELFFGREPLEDEGVEPAAPPDMFRRIQDDEVVMVRPQNRAEVESFSPEVPTSLRTAVEYFLLATAARWARGHRMKHSSMLIHTAMNLSVHRALKARVEGEIKRIRGALKKTQTRTHLEELWSSEHARVPREGLKPVPFAAVEAQLPGVLARLRVVVDNSQSDNRLVYKEEQELGEADEVVHIAVGGNTLSRGLTLEGLVVSYFVRSASAYDTLLQMGRWFGYRFGYEDLPRIWMTDELRQSFHDMATVEEEIRADIARYEEENVTPREFAVRIRTHPSMTVTSKLKMQHAVTVQIDYAGFTRQTTYFHHRNAAWLSSNWAAGAALVNTLAREASFEEKGPHRFVRHVPAARVLEFLAAYKCHEQHTELRREFLQKYVEKQLSRGECQKWTVCVVTLADTLPTTHLGALRIAPVSRSILQRSGDGVDLGTITTQQNFGFDLPDVPRPPASDATIRKRRQPKRPPGSEPLLILVPINRASKASLRGEPPHRQDLDAEDDILGIALAFPGSGSKKVGESYIQVRLPDPPDYVEADELSVEEDDG